MKNGIQFVAKTETLGLGGFPEITPNAAAIAKVLL
jgi:hypothetical protein